MRRGWWVATTVAAACGSGGRALPADAGVDAAPDATPPACLYAPLPASTTTGGRVIAGAVTAGAAEGRLDLPVGSTLGAFTGRASFVGAAADGRAWPWSGVFMPSVGIETAPKARALALSAGGETIVVLKVDLGVAYDGLAIDLGVRLGLPGKVLVTVSHSHASWGHYSGNPAMGLAFGRFHRAQYDRLLGRLEAVARAALAARRAARVGVFIDDDFDPDDQVSHDRRGANNALAGGPEKDHRLVLIRVDGSDGEPLAVLPVFGVHGIVLDYDNPWASSDAPGAIERAVEESFDGKVVVMHLQGAGGDVSPSQGEGLDCRGETACQDFARDEKVGRAAVGPILAAWRAAGARLEDTLALEMVTRSVELGPSPATFAVRDGALAYAPWDGVTPADGKVFADGGALISPVDEFNAPAGAPLCGGGELSGLLPGAALPGTKGLRAYESCLDVASAGFVVGRLFGLDLSVTPICATTRTTLSALRLGEHVFITLPGEPVTLLARHLRALSPAPPEKTVVLGYAQGHIGYVLTAEDWLQGGLEPSINFWGPLEGEYLAEQAARLARLVTTDEREDGAAGGTDAWVTPATSDEADVPPVDPAPRAGTVPETVPAELFARGGSPPTSAQPALEVPRLGVVRFVWIGEDPLAGTPVVTLQRDAGSGFTEVLRRSGRPVEDGDILRTWTPVPLRRAPGEHATHYWMAEWQAATWWGTAGADEPGDRAGVPLGRYRLHVAGTGYALDSRPFTVVAGALRVAVTAASPRVALSLAYSGAGGFRLLDPTAASNRDVPLRGGKVQVTWRDGVGDALGSIEATVGGDGALTLDAVAGARSLRVVDRFGNAGEAALP